jgi:hypothetical protein
MSPLIASTLRRVIAGACVLVFAASSLLAQGFSTQSAEEPMPYDADTIALVLARKYLEGGDGARDALHEALDRMGWGVRNEKGDLLRSPPAGTATGLAMRDYEIEELTWNLDALPAIRLINYAQVLAIPFEADDPERSRKTSSSRFASPPRAINRSNVSGRVSSSRSAAPAPRITICSRPKQT